MRSSQFVKDYIYHQYKAGDSRLEIYKALKGFGYSTSQSTVHSYCKKIAEGVPTIDKLSTGRKVTVLTPQVLHTELLKWFFILKFSNASSYIHLL